MEQKRFAVRLLSLQGAALLRFQMEVFTEGGASRPSVGNLASASGGASENRNTTATSRAKRPPGVAVEDRSPRSRDDEHDLIPLGLIAQERAGRVAPPVLGTAMRPLLPSLVSERRRRKEMIMGRSLGRRHRRHQPWSMRRQVNSSCCGKKPSSAAASLIPTRSPD